ncbi:MAG: fasciclin domain-containing protein [Calditrichaeota bacterium]|nr:MAG: fasciclin domain-containing protein [Calditrichota bacterium]
MKKLATIALAVLFIAGSSEAHCGACGTEKGKDDHTHVEKTSVKSESNIVETAKAAGSFKTLLAALNAAGLDKALTGEGPFTVFAPTDEAFAALPEGTVEALLKDKKKLTSILTYHVVEGKVTAKEVTGLDKASTLNGQNIMIKADNNMVMINNAQVTTTDITCSNGIIHVINAVLIPEEKK